MKRTFQNLLAYLAKKIIIKYHPLVIGITGSVGKTSTKEAVFHVVSQRYTARRSEKNFNNELGVPLTIIGADAPGRNPFKWLLIIIKSFYLVLTNQNYPQMLILEMGIDRVGDMDYLLSIAHPNISVITSIGVSHYEFFKNSEALEQEKGKIAEVLLPEEILIVNADNPAAFRQSKKTKAKVISFGVTNIADVRVFDVQQSVTSGKAQSIFSVKTPSKTFTAAVQAAGQTHLSSTAVAIAVAEAISMDTEPIIKGLNEYKPIPGRLNIIPGIKRTIIIDDTYNAAPDSMRAALSVLKGLPVPYKIAVLGDMLELGAISEKEHLEIGKQVFQMGTNKLITVGSMGKIIAEGARNAGMDPDHILSFDNSTDSLNGVQNLLVPESAMLIKGSQGMRMEKITKEIMAEPMRAKDLLCRQYGKWLAE